MHLPSCIIETRHATAETNQDTSGGPATDTRRHRTLTKVGKYTIVWEFRRALAFLGTAKCFIMKKVDKILIF